LRGGQRLRPRRPLRHDLHAQPVEIVWARRGNSGVSRADAKEPATGAGSLN
jgi:hypothetical protein